MVDQELTVQMIDLVGQCPGSQVLFFNLVGVALFVLGFHHDPPGTRHFFEDVGEAETPLFASLLPFGTLYAGIDQDISPFPQAYHRHPEGSADLGSGEAHAIVGFHGFPQIGDQKGQVLAKIYHVFRHSA